MMAYIFAHALQAGHHQVQGVFAIIAVCLINGLESVQQGHAPAAYQAVILP